MRRNGFSLIELLVVIAIIAILAAILFPVFARARAKARQASCLSNVKQLMLSVHMYAQDYDGGFPARQGPPWTWPMDILVPYVKNSEIFTCPEKKGGWGSAKGARYGVCWDLWGTGYLGNEGSFTKPAETAYLLEGYDCVYVHHWMQMYPYWRNCDDNAQGSPDELPHNGGSNFGFADGHGKWLDHGKFASYGDWLQLNNPNK